MKKLTLVSLLTVGLTGLSSAATVLLAEGFESPSVSTYTANSIPDNGDWIASDSGGNPFGWGNKGLHNESDTTNPFTTLYGSQGYSMRFYQGAVLTTTLGAIGTVADAAEYQVAFNVADVTAGATSAPYKVELWALSGVTDDNRKNVAWDSAGTRVLLGSASGNVSTNNMSFADSISYTADASYVGYDLAVRLVGMSGSEYATYDNLSVTLVPEPAAALLGAIGSLLLLGRRR